MDGMLIEEYVVLNENLPYSEKLLGFYERDSNFTKKQSEDLIKAKSEEELKVLYENQVRLWQVKQAYFRGDKTHTYSRLAVSCMDEWDREIKRNEKETAKQREFLEAQGVVFTDDF